MTEEFLQSPVLLELGVDHGFGRPCSDGAGVPGIVLSRQVHGNAVREVPPLEKSAEADALWTRQPGVAVGVRTADCVAVLIADCRHRAVAAVHAGWRGSASRVAERAVLQLVRALRAQSGELRAVIGPHIGPCCYEVDTPVRNAISEGNVFLPSDREGHYRLDLFELNRRQLVAAGLRPGDISRVGGCTFCDPLLYPSYRRDGSGERMLHFVRLPLP